MSVNPIKAEKIVKFDSVEYKARMSLDTVIRIETHFKTTILKIGKRLQESDLSLLDCIAFLTLAIRSGGNDINENKIKDLVSQQPYLETIKMVGELVTLALDVETEEPTEEKKSTLTQAS